MLNKGNEQGKCRVVMRLKGGEAEAEKELRRKGVIVFYPALDPDLSGMVLISPG